MSCITVEASMKLTSKISIRYDELYFAGVWVISPVRRFPRRRISSRTPWSRVDPKPFSLDLWCFRTTLWLWTWIVKLVRRFFFAKFILLHIRNVIALLSFPLSYQDIFNEILSYVKLSRYYSILWKDIDR